MGNTTHLFTETAKYVFRLINGYENSEDDLECADIRVSAFCRKSGEAGPATLIASFHITAESELDENDEIIPRVNLRHSRAYELSQRNEAEDYIKLTNSLGIKCKSEIDECGTPFGDKFLIAEMEFIDVSPEDVARLMSAICTRSCSSDEELYIVIRSIHEDIEEGVFDVLDECVLDASGNVCDSDKLFDFESHNITATINSKFPEVSLKFSEYSSVYNRAIEWGIYPIAILEINKNECVFSGEKSSNCLNFGHTKIRYSFADNEFHQVFPRKRLEIANIAESQPVIDFLKEYASHKD